MAVDLQNLQGQKLRWTKSSKNNYFLDHGSDFIAVAFRVDGGYRVRLRDDLMGEPAVHASADAAMDRAEALLGLRPQQ